MPKMVVTVLTLSCCCLLCEHNSLFPKWILFVHVCAFLIYVCTDTSFCFSFPLGLKTLSRKYFFFLSSYIFNNYLLHFPTVLLQNAVKKTHTHTFIISTVQLFYCCGPLIFSPILPRNMPNSFLLFQISGM